VTPDLTTHNGRSRLRLERRLPATVDEVWPYLTEAELFGRWYPAAVREMDVRPGGTIELDYGGGITVTATVAQLEENALLTLVEPATADMPHEGDSLLRIELRAEGARTVLLFAQEFDDRPAAASYAAGWEACLDALENALAGRDAEAPAPSVERHQYYVRLFGLDQPSIAAHEVLVERQLMGQSPDKVWRVLLPDGDPDLTALVPPGLGQATVIDHITDVLLVLTLPDGSAVSWEMQAGPGGARLVVAHSPLSVDDEGTLWRTHVENLVERIIAAD
jgi:uncharacterized protein YndB with AHSA1/START domain